MRCPALLGSQADYRQYRSLKPTYDPCPQGGQQGTRKRVMTRRLPHGAGRHRRSWRVAAGGVYQARCACGTYVQAPIPGVPARGRYALAVRTPVANALRRERRPSGLGIRRLQEDDRLTLSLGSLPAGCIWAHAQSHLAAPWAFVRATFAGGLCSDAVHARGRTILWATAPLGNFTVSVTLVETNAQDHLDAFFQALKEGGRAAQVILTDASPLSQEARQRSWYDVEPQLGILPGSKEVNQLLLDGGRASKNRLKRQGNTGRKQRRGRPTKPAPQPRPPRSGMSKQAPASFIGAPQYLMVRTQDDLREQAKADRALLWPMAPARQLLRHFHPPLYRLLAQGLPKPWARSRRTRLVKNPLDQATAFLAKALKQIGTDQCDKMLVFLGWDHGQCPNQHVERNNRGFRMMQKTRSKRRKTHTMEQALELERYARMVEPP